MSGTSADGISAAAVRVGSDWIEPVASWDTPYSPTARQRLLGLGSASPPELARASFQLGEWFAAAAAAMMRKLGRRADFVASHGHTVVHGPRDRVAHTLQIGEPSVIAERTGVTTVANFRPRDMAAGGQGAPLVPFFDHFVFSGKAPVAMLNLGGIANVTWVERASARTAATDLGPGNCMIDEAVRVATRGRRSFDEGGQLARQGRLDGRLLDRLMRHPFLSLRPPKSACRSEFVPNPDVSAKLRLDPLGAIATLTRFTAEAAADGLRRRRFSRVIVSGGGVFNDTLMGHLKDLLYPAPVESISAYGWPPLAKEPAAFALLGDRTLRGHSCTLSGATGASHAVVAGELVPGLNFRSLMRRLHS